jgi:hypothetical protein
MAGDGDDVRRRFIREAQARVLNLLEELHQWHTRYRHAPPSWTYERIAALADQVATDDDVPTIRLQEAIEATEHDLERALSEIAAILCDPPMPYVPTSPAVLEPPPPPPRRFLVLRGGRA